MFHLTCWYWYQYYTAACFVSVMSLPKPLFLCCMDLVFDSMSSTRLYNVQKNNQTCPSFHFFFFLLFSFRICAHLHSCSFELFTQAHSDIHADQIHTHTHTHMRAHTHTHIHHGINYILFFCNYKHNSFRTLKQILLQFGYITKWSSYRPVHILNDVLYIASYVQQCQTV